MQGVCVSHQYWDYEERDETYVEIGRDNKPVIDYEGNQKTRTQVTSIRDKPVIEVISPENLRIDPASDWSDPLESSPYIIHLIPMYLQDIVSISLI